MAVSTEVGLAFLQCGAVLIASVGIRGYCARHLTAEMVPMVLRSRIELCNRLAPVVLLIGAAMVATGALVYFRSR